MGDLSDYRREIDEVDAQLVPLFERRMRAVRQVALYKKKHGLPVLQQDREQQVIEQACARLQDASYAPETERLMRTIMALSRAVQTRDLAESDDAAVPLNNTNGIAGFQGTDGSFSEQALIEYFGAEHPRRSYPQFEDVFRALQNGEIAYGVLPIENSSTGAIAAVYDLLGRYGFYIVGERRLKISQNLVGLPGASLSDIRTVYSHAQGLEQSSGFLAQHPEWELIPFHNTAVSARRVAQENDPSKAAIASVRAAQVHGLEVIVPNIQNAAENTTRFIVIGREIEDSGADKVSLVFALDNESGTLFRALRYFADQGISLVKIESRPIPDALWHYLFYLDFEGRLESHQVQTALDQLMRDAKYYKMLGAYKSDT